MEDWDFFWGFVSASLFWFAWNRYKIGPKKIKMEPDERRKL